MPKPTPERILRVRLLLDHEAERWQLGRNETPRGTPAPTSWLDCPDCHGTGRGGGCSRCEGRGLLMTDPYTSGADVHGINQATGEKMIGQRPARRETMELYEIEAVLARIEQDMIERGEMADTNRDTDPWHRVELHRVLRHMRDGGQAVLRQCYDAVAAVHWPAMTARPLDKHPIRTQLLETIAVHWLATRMRGRIPFSSEVEDQIAAWRQEQEKRAA